MFINLSNHNSALWSDAQKKAASEYGEIKDIAFPDIPARFTEKETTELADKYCETIIALKPDYVMCQGEFTFVYHIVSRLKKYGIKTAAACSERNVSEFIDKDGLSFKKSIFIFVKFREYT